jgi:hypothetical protein
MVPHTPHTLQNSAAKTTITPTKEDMTEDNVSLDNIEGGNGSKNVSYIVPDFMPAARDIVNQFPCPDEALLTETRAFQKTFGTSLHLVKKLWFLLNQEEL